MGLGPVVALGCLVLALGGFIAAIAGEPTMGVGFDLEAQTVTSVLPGSAPWRHGIRAGQRIVTLTPADEPEGWSLVTTDGPIEFGTNERAAVRELREVAVFGLLGLGVAIVGALAAAFGASAGGAFALALGLATIPLLRQGSPGLASLGLAAGIAGPAVWLGLRLRPAWPVTLALSVACLVAVVGWIAGRWLWPPLFDPFDWLAFGLRAGLLVAVGLVALARPGSLRAVTTSTLRSIDVAITILLGVGLALAGSLDPGSLPWVLLGAAAFLVAYPRWRRAAAELLDRLLVGELREQVAIGATEAERARLARDLHDAPLQELAAVIRRLERDPAQHAETEPLREIAASLRHFASELHPAVLEDLGLGPALEALLEHAAVGGLAVEAAVESRAGFTRSSRPPAEVELALYRVIQEGVRNVERHSAATRLSLRGSIAPGRIELALVDDGVGITPAALTAALRAGRLGLASMRSRMAAIGGAVEVGPGEGGRGTAVRMRWPA